MSFRSLSVLLTLVAALTNVVTPSVVPAQPDTTQSVPQRPSTSSRLFPPRLGVGSIIYLPKVYYSSESSVGLGGQVLYPFRFSGCHPSTPYSDLRLDGRITLEGHAKAELTANLHLASGKYFLKTKWSYDTLPQRFWGLGPSAPSANQEVYRPQSLRAYAEIFREVIPNIRMGLRYEVERLQYLEREAGGLLNNEPFPGADACTAAGAGFVLEWDTRDRRYAPTSGYYFQGFALWFDDSFGSQHDFNNYSVDLRRYLHLSRDHVLALQGFLYAAKGEPPIWRYAALGGRAHTRGYRKGRYLDRVLLSVQGEYRLPTIWRLEAVFFGGVGDVGSRLGSIQLKNMRPTLGGGLRFLIAPEKGIKLRLDLATGQESVRAYLSLGDAF